MQNGCRSETGTPSALPQGAARCGLPAQITRAVAPGSVYTSFHFSETPVNRLTIDTQDPIAKCPEYKVCAVRIEKAS